jgi:hypothetical protein
MPKPKKTVGYNADDGTILRYFDASTLAKKAQREASGEICSLNVRMQDDGVDPGTLATCQRLARMKPGKRGISVALLHRYLQVLASRLEDPTAPAEVADTAATAPFARPRAVA